MIRSEPVRCERPKCGGFVYSPAVGEAAALIRRVTHSEQAHPEHIVCACGRCGTLYELRIQRANAA
jgi:hypothetical protein